MQIIRISILIFLSILGFLISPPSALATKCLKETTKLFFVKGFPFVFTGRIISRVAVHGSSNEFDIKISVEKIIKGNFKDKIIIAQEIHSSNIYEEKHIYAVNKEFVFPAVKGKNGEPVVILPSDGCAPLANEDNR